MPNDKKFTATIKVDATPLEKLADRLDAITKSMNDAVKNPKITTKSGMDTQTAHEIQSIYMKMGESMRQKTITEFAAKDMQARINTVNPPAYRQDEQRHSDMLGSIAGLVSRLTGGVIPSRVIQSGIGKAPSGAGGIAGGAGGAAIAAPVAAAMIGVNILEKIFGVLEGLAPIRALLKVMTTILQLTFLPLAMVLMALLMPFLLPVLKLFQLFPWMEFFSLTKQIAAFLAPLGQFLAPILIALVVAIALPLIMILGVIIGMVLLLAVIFDAMKIAWNAISGPLKDIFGWLAGIMGTELNILSETLRSLWGTVQLVMSWLSGTAISVWNAISSFVSTISSGIGNLYNLFVGAMDGVWNTISSAVGGTWNVLQSILSWFQGTMQPIFTTIQNAISAVTGAVNSVNPSNVVSTIGNVIGGIGSALGLASGGAVVQQGLAYIHAGETVLPKGAVGIAGQVVPKGAALGGTVGAGGEAGHTINITVNASRVNSELDMNTLARTVAKAVSDEARKLRTW